VVGAGEEFLPPQARRHRVEDTISIFERKIREPNGCSPSNLVAIRVIAAEIAGRIA